MRSRTDGMHGQALRIGLAIVAAAFVVLAVTAHYVAYFPADLAITRALQTTRNPVFDALSLGLDWPGFPPQSNVVFGGIVLLLVVRRHFLAALAEILAAGGSAALWFGIAPLVGRPRPSPDLVYVAEHLTAGSFPSGHVLNLGSGLGFAWFLSYALLPPSWWRTTILWVLPAYLLLLGIARAYTGEHWPSDVLGGYLLATLWLWICVSVYRRAAAELRRRRASRQVG